MTRKHTKLTPAKPVPATVVPSTLRSMAFGFDHLAKCTAKLANEYSTRQDDPELARLYHGHRQSIGNWAMLTRRDLPDAPALGELPTLDGSDYFGAVLHLSHFCERAAAVLLDPGRAGSAKPGQEAPPAEGKATNGGYDPDAYIPVKEVRERMKPPCDCGKWTKIKKANPWIRFDPKAPTQRPRIHRADADKLRAGKMNPDTFELLDVQGQELQSITQIQQEYMTGIGRRKAEIDAEKRQRGG